MWMKKELRQWWMPIKLCFICLGCWNFHFLSTNIFPHQNGRNFLRQRIFSISKRKSNENHIPNLTQYLILSFAFSGPYSHAMWFWLSFSHPVKIVECLFSIPFYVSQMFVDWINLNGNVIKVCVVHKLCDQF